MLARVSITSTAPGRAAVQTYNGPKAVRDHGRVATRNSGGAADKGTLASQLDSGFDLPVIASRPRNSNGFDNRAADDVQPHVIVPNDRKLTLKEYNEYLEKLFAVSSAPLELTP